MHFNEKSEEKTMDTEIKTLAGWRTFAKRTRKENIFDYLNAGDVVAEDIISYFMDTLPLRTMSKNYLQFGEAVDYIHDFSRIRRPIYITFARYDSPWRYYGCCFLWETIDRSIR